MATDDTQAIAAQQVVFIDSDVPDIQDLIAGQAPGVKAFVLNSSSDGVQQIASLLAADDLTDLSSISIVGHGAAGEIQLGSSLLDSGDLSSESAALAQIGAALAPGGDLQLYACDTASGATGQQFIADLSQYIGGAPVAASSNLVGASAEGGSWALNAGGAADVASPFTAAAETAYSGELNLTANQIVFGVWNGNGGSPQNVGNRIEQFGVSGSTASGLTDLVDGSQTSGTVLEQTSGVAVDTALNEYFVASYNETTFTWTIQEGSTSGGDLSTFYTDPLPALNANTTPGGAPITGTAAVLGGLALDAQSGELYFAQSAENWQTGDYDFANTGIYEVSVKGGTPTLLTPSNGTVFNPDYIALDAPANLLFFTDSIEAADGFTAVDNLDAVNLTTGAVTVLKSFFNADDSVDQLEGLAVSGDKIYVTTREFDSTNGSLGADSANNQILSMSFSVSGSGSTATASVGAATTLYSGAGAHQPTDIVVDAANGVFYTTGETLITVDSSPGDTATIFEGSLSGGSSLTPVLSMQDVTGTITAETSPAFDTFAPQLVLLTPPVITAGATVIAGIRGPAVTADSGVTVTDEDGQNLAGATVSGAQADDTLSFNGGNPDTFTDGGQISSSFSAGVLTLTGNASVADYQSALDSVTFATTSTDTATPRTLDWTVTDGVVTSATVTSTVDVAVCYCRGTPILTDKGEVAIERLSIGDIVVTASGENKPVKWIGWRDINCASHPDPESVWPVRVTAGAVAPGLPVRDLVVSPEHSLFLDGVLVPARLLVNATTILQERVASVSYWHVELDRHDLLIAAGLAAESYLDCRNRTAFANGGSVAALHPDFSPRGEWREHAHWAEHSCAPRHLDGPILRGIRKSLARRAVELGARTTRDPGVQVLADGEALTPVSVLDGCFRFEAPADAISLRLRSRNAVLAQLVDADSAETRRLGVCATKIVVDGRDIALDAPELSDGWHEVEGEAPHQWRWSNGNAGLPIGGSVVLWLRPLPAAYPLPPRAPVAARSQVKELRTA